MENGNNGLIICALVIAGLVVGAYLAFRKKTASANNTDGLSYEHKDSLSMKEVIEYFKEPKALQELEQNKDYIAVAIKSQTNDNKTKILLTIFDKGKNDIIDTPAAKGFIVNSLDSELLGHFGDKDMIILQ
ncbi:hypothetical protein DCO58_09065 [Helicobacter saguini]|uniref:Uncharacterized protein n=1 Tax=Helicobacter saguini TaxID=1548018 RepID=A0A347W5A2_9HELI|nr:hypothetical protein [Helicobacter saguini]MWV61531.1 hypothetical protein [Helicobacter saguini]MWV67799.1 hypothetical protein [Helicobacter saguini]MWV70733.1 hypothetical protein [Helicobacter saguini]MWV72636.1 hypothetical protein [Helicobacter saguini]TLD94557.1 hypothetical protein LS64_005165 [Helicobacter saguini]